MSSIAPILYDIDTLDSGVFGTSGSSTFEITHDGKQKLGVGLLCGIRCKQTAGTADSVKVQVFADDAGAILLLERTVTFTAGASTQSVIDVRVPFFRGLWVKFKAAAASDVKVDFTAYADLACKVPACC